MGQAEQGARSAARRGTLGTLAAVALLLVVTACSGPGGPDAGSTATGQPGASAPSSDEDELGEDVPSALKYPKNPDLPEALIDLDHLVSGGPPPDGIPPIDEPEFEPADEVEWLAGDDPVLALTIDDETRGYPISILTWHEIVNDEVAGTPVAVTYCPLCNSGVAFQRVVDGRTLDFGTSGMLYADNLVMYDRQTESLWPQLTGLASVGALTGTQLEAIPMGAIGWDQFREAHPDALVLTRETGHERPYGTNPYVGYDRPDGPLLVDPPGDADERLLVKDRVVGLRSGSESLAVTRTVVAGAGVTEVSVGGRSLVLWHLPGQASALDTADVSEGHDIGTVAVFEPQADGRALTWRREGGAFVDEQTGSRWNIVGEAVAGPLKGTRLRPHRFLDTFWFAWVAFQPETRLQR